MNFGETQENQEMNTANEETKPATVSFSRAKQVAGAKAPAPAGAPTAAVVPADTNTAVAVPDDGGGCVVGEFSSAILKKPPVIKLVSGNSEAALTSPEWIGQFIWDNAVALGKELVIIPTRLTNSFKEDRPFGDKNPTPPAHFKTYAEARASGLKIMDVAIIEMLIELAPEQAKLEPLEAHKVSLAGKEYLPATMWVQKTAYDCARTLVHDFKKWLGGRLANGQYKLSVKIINGASGPFRSPTMKAHGKTPADVSDAIAAEFSI